MKTRKMLFSIATIALMSMLIAVAYAPLAVPIPPTPCGCYYPGFTPGFWKHNINVRLDPTMPRTAYSAFVGGPLDGVKLDNDMMDGYLAAINSALGASFTFEQLLGYLELKGNDPLRTNTANWFNYVAGYYPYL